MLLCLRLAEQSTAAPTALGSIIGVKLPHGHKVLQQFPHVCVTSRSSEPQLQSQLSELCNFFTYETGTGKAYFPAWQPYL